VPLFSWGIVFRGGAPRPSSTDYNVQINKDINRVEVVIIVVVVAAAAVVEVAVVVVAAVAAAAVVVAAAVAQ
jgi:hypothetical protein